MKMQTRKGSAVEITVAIEILEALKKNRRTTIINNNISETAREEDYG